MDEEPIPSTSMQSNIASNSRQNAEQNWDDSWDESEPSPKPELPSTDIQFPVDSAMTTDPNLTVEPYALSYSVVNESGNQCSSQCLALVPYVAPIQATGSILEQIPQEAASRATPHTSAEDKELEAVVPGNEHIAEEAAHTAPNAANAAEIYNENFEEVDVKPIQVPLFVTSNTSEVQSILESARVSTGANHPGTSGLASGSRHDEAIVEDVVFIEAEPIVMKYTRFAMPLAGTTDDLIKKENDVVSNNMPFRETVIVHSSLYFFNK